MRRLILLAGLALACVLSFGCMTPEQQRSSMAERQIKQCDRLLAYNRQRNAPKVAAIYTSLLKTIPHKVQFYAVHRRVLLKRGEVYHLMGEKEKADVDFKLAAKIAARMNAPAAAPAETAAPGAARPGPGPGQAGAAEKPVFPPGRKAPREQKEVFSSKIEIWGSLFSQWRILRDDPAGDGTKIHPRRDLGSDQFTVYGLLRNEIKLFPRLSGTFDIGLGSLGGEDTVSSFNKYDGCVLPYGESLEMQASFFEISGALRWTPKMPLPGTASLELGAKYTMFTLDLDFGDGTGFTDIIDAFYPVVGLNYSVDVVRGVRIMADLRLCGFYYSSSDFKVYTTYFEFFGGCEIKIAPHIFAWGGFRYAYSTYEFSRDGEDKELTYAQAGPSLGLTLRV